MKKINPVSKLFKKNIKVTHTKEGQPLLARFEVACPKCGSQLPVSGKQVKKRLRCGKCGHTFEIIGTGVNTNQPKP